MNTVSCNELGPLYGHFNIPQGEVKIRNSQFATHFDNEDVTAYINVVNERSEFQQ